MLISYIPKVLCAVQQHVASIQLEDTACTCKLQSRKELEWTLFCISQLEMFLSRMLLRYVQSFTTKITLAWESVKIYCVQTFPLHSHWSFHLQRQPPFSPVTSLPLPHCLSSPSEKLCPTRRFSHCAENTLRVNTIFHLSKKVLQKAL